jgi:hypothetical protein
LTRALVGAVAVACFAAASGSAAAVQAPKGVAAPTPGSGIGTKAAMANSRCRTGTEYGVYGQFDGIRQGQGPVCVKPWSSHDDNGGATAPGVTADAVRVVVVTPLPSQTAGAAAPVNRATGGKGTYEDAYHDYIEAYMNIYETWGRGLDVHFVTSSGSDEAQQRADALKIKELKPFAAIISVSAGLPTLAAELAKAKILVQGAATTREIQAQAPYRWNVTDPQASALNAAAFIGEQLAGKQAVYGGDDVSGSKRKFGFVYIDDLLDAALVEKALRQHGGEGFASTATYTAPGSITGDATSAQEQAPVILQRLKSAGVTTIALVTDSAMTSALMKQATQQEYFPEWLFTGSMFADLPLFARGYPADQMAHAFGLTQGVPPLPATLPGKEYTGTPGALNWYWGATSGTTQNAPDSDVQWLLGGIHAAGPKLTAETFKQGWFSTPPRSASEIVSGPITAYGRSAGLPYDSYSQYGGDYSTFWWDPDLTGLSWGVESVGKGNTWFVNDADRYTLGTVPSKPMKFFSKSNAISSFDNPPPLAPVAACAGCPSQGGPGTAGTPSPDGFVAKYVAHSTGAG